MLFINSKHINFIIILFLTIFLTHCQKNRVLKTHGIFYLENRAALLESENTNRNDVIKILGQPHSKSLKDKNTWIYIERTRTRGKMLKLGRNILKHLRSYKNVFTRQRSKDFKKDRKNN